MKKYIDAQSSAIVYEESICKKVTEKSFKSVSVKELIILSDLSFYINIMGMKKEGASLALNFENISKKDLRALKRCKESLLTQVTNLRQKLNRAIVKISQIEKDKLESMMEEKSLDNNMKEVV